jgi:predicted phosphohydrolase
LAVDGDVIEVGGKLICGCLGSPPVEGGADPMVERLRSCLSVAAERRRPGQPLLVLWHYSPFATGTVAGAVVGVLEDHGVTACVYGHLHQVSQWSAAVQGLHRGVRYHCVAADAIGFRPLRIQLL